MNTNKSRTTKTQAPKQATTAAEDLVKAKHIKLGIDVHLDRYVVVRILDGGTPQPPQRFGPAEFLKGSRGPRCSHFWPGVWSVGLRLGGTWQSATRGKAVRPGAEHGRPEVRLTTPRASVCALFTRERSGQRQRW